MLSILHLLYILFSVNFCHGDGQSVVDGSGGSNNDPSNDSMFFAADACPKDAGLKPTSLEKASATFNIVCCDSSMECSRIFNPCLDWKNTKLSQRDAAQACEQLGPGHRLCTLEELDTEVCCNKGCGADHIKVWTSDSHTATTYYVDSGGGNDENDGSNLAEAFKTLQKCVDTLSPLDSCILRGGRYHESVMISEKSNITIAGYKDEKAIMDGTLVLIPNEEAWSLDAEGVCSGTIDSDVYQLFLDEDMMTNARWPDALWKENEMKERTVFDEKYWGHSSGESTKGKMIDKEGLLGSSNLNMTGAMAILNTGSWATFVKPVISHQAGSNYFEYVDDFEKDDNYDPPLPPIPAGKGGPYNFHAKNNRYYIDSKRNLLNKPGEWHFDYTTKILSFMPYDGICPLSSSQRVRGRTLDYAINVTDTVDMTVANLTFFASAFIADSDKKLTQDIRLDTLNFIFPSSSKRMLGKIDLPGWTQVNSQRNGKLGYVEVTNCVFFGGEGAALSYKGLRPRIHNNEFRWNDWTGQLDLYRHGGYATVYSQAIEEELSHNTFENNGCMNSFNPSLSTKPNVTRNRVMGTCRGNIQNDGAALHFQIKAQENGILQQNWVYDSPKIGIRTDAATVNPNMNLGQKTIFKDNVVWDVGRGFLIKGDNHTITGNLALQNSHASVFGDFTEQCSLFILKYLANNDYNGKKVLSPLMNNNSIIENNSAWLACGGKKPGWKQEVWEEMGMDGNGGFWPIPDGATNTYSNSNIRELLIDAENYDFRPKPNNALTIDDESFIGPYSPNIGSVNTNKYLGHYWIPGRKMQTTSFPIPKNKALIEKMRDVVICQTGYRSQQHDFYIGVSYRSVKKANVHSNEFQGTFLDDQNVFPINQTLAISKPGGPYFWRVDAINEFGHVFKGKVWRFRVGN